jgi:hypothetical protein
MTALVTRQWDVSAVPGTDGTSRSAECQRPTRDMKQRAADVDANLGRAS